ncbi:MAG: ABC transporter ATP-binding protein [bacterium]|nr:ABC transporter ATP-binding protein [bacterium]
MTAPILTLKGLSKSFPLKGGLFNRVKNWVHAVQEVDLELLPGQTLGLVGESGSGKSTLARLILRLIEPSAGQVIFRGKDLTQLGHRQMIEQRRGIQMIFQDPLDSLNARWSIGQIIAEPLEIQGQLNRQEREAEVARLLELVGLSVQAKDRFPHEFSGGQRQRVGVARALALKPQLILADEPVSALDVSIQAQILNLLKDLQEELGLSYLFIAHDIHVIRFIAQRIAVMYMGRIVELGDAQELSNHPLHPYTRALWAAVPSIDAGPGLCAPLQGEVPSLINPPQGCAFHPRCPIARPDCSVVRPKLTEIQPGHWAACPYGSL